MKAKRSPAAPDRRHGLRAHAAPAAGRPRRVALTFVSSAQAYCWTTGGERSRVVAKH